CQERGLGRRDQARLSQPPIDYFSSDTGSPASQSERERAASFARRIRSRSTACSSSAALSAAATRPCVGRTQAVGQRVTPLFRINSATAASGSSSGGFRRETI